MHPIIGYTDAIHVLPAVATAALYFAGLALMRPGMQPTIPVAAQALHRFGSVKSGILAQICWQLIAHWHDPAREVALYPCCLRLITDARAESFEIGKVVPVSILRALFRHVAKSRAVTGTSSEQEVRKH